MLASISRKELFLRACEKGYVDIVKEHIQYINPDDICGGFVLACIEDQLEVVKYIHSNYDNDVNHLYQVSFHYCCESGRLDIVKYFIKHCTKIFLNYQIGIISACKTYQLEVINYLLPTFNIDYINFFSKRLKKYKIEPVLNHFDKLKKEYSEFLGEFIHLPQEVLLNVVEFLY